MGKELKWLFVLLALSGFSLPAAAFDDPNALPREALIQGTWELTVQGEPPYSPTRFIMQVGPYNRVLNEGNIDITQDDAFRSSGKGPYTRVGYNAWQFRDVHYHYDDTPPYGIIAKETHEFDLKLTGPNTATSIKDARIYVEDLDGNIQSDIRVPIDAVRLPRADSF